MPLQWFLVYLHEVHNEVITKRFCSPLPLALSSDYIVILLRIMCMRFLSYGPPWAHYLGGYQDRLLGGPLGLPDLCRTTLDGVRRKDYGGEVLG
jgi:hypothetical protein